MKINRRHFLHTTTLAGAGLAAGAPSAASANASEVRWPVGCFNRPWTQWGYDATLDGIKAAGYNLTGLLSRTRADPFIGVDATPEYLASLKTKITARGLKANMGALRSRHDIAVEDSVKEMRLQIDHAKFL